MNYRVRNCLRRIRFAIGEPQLFGSLRKRFVGPFGSAVLARSENGLLLVPVSDAFVGRSLCFKGRYDDAVLNFLLSQCNSESDVLVVGAHVGAFAVPLAKRARHVVAVEANPATYELLRLNALLNGLNNLEIHNFAAGDRETETSFIVARTNTGGSRVKAGEGSRTQLREKMETVTVRIRRLDDVFPNSTFDLTVMDIEGSETLALRGMPRLLARSGALVVEIVEQHLRQIANVTNEEFLSLITPYFDEAVILPEGAKKEGQDFKVYCKSAFGELMKTCCQRDIVTNVMFRPAAKRTSDRAQSDNLTVSLQSALEPR